MRERKILHRQHVSQCLSQSNHTQDLKIATGCRATRHRFHDRESLPPSYYTVVIFRRSNPRIGGVSRMRTHCIHSVIRHLSPRYLINPLPGLKKPRPFQDRSSFLYLNIDESSFAAIHWRALSLPDSVECILCNTCDTRRKLNSLYVSTQLDTRI